MSTQHTPGPWEAISNMVRSPRSPELGAGPPPATTGEAANSKNTKPKTSEGTMGLAEILDAHADWQERQADASDKHEEEQIKHLQDEWDACLRQRSIDAEIGGDYYGDLIEVLNEACSDLDQTINRALMQALVRCAAKGQVEAVEALDKVKDFFINKTMDFKNESPRPAH